MNIKPWKAVCGGWIAALAMLLVWAVPVVSHAQPQGGGAASADLYAVTPEPLTPVQCGQCHTKHFADLRASGGKHKFECQNCHQVFHAYNPLRNNYAEIMPKCAMCHALPHGEKQVACLNCHSNPHAPTVAPAVEKVKGVCADCHSGPAEQLKASPSKHTQQPCASCHHTKHGYIPACSECHEPHFKGQDFAGCQSCHPVHKPLDIKFTKDADAQTCSGCHAPVFAKWKGTPSKHGQVNCTMCHTSHGAIPACLDCHAAPHPEAQLKMFPRCLDCHLDVHDLPVKKKK